VLLERRLREQLHLQRWLQRRRIRGVVRSDRPKRRPERALYVPNRGPNPGGRRVRVLSVRDVMRFRASPSS